MTLVIERLQWVIIIDDPGVIDHEDRFSDLDVLSSEEA